jgi:cytochrome c peroxidase
MAFVVYRKSHAVRCVVVFSLVALLAQSCVVWLNARVLNAEHSGGWLLFAPIESMHTSAHELQAREQIELGKMLFFDVRLSGDSSISCASCHDPAHGWAFPDEISRGYPGTANWRNSPTIVNAGYLRRLFWTGHASTLEAQAKAAGTGAIELHGKPSLLESRLAAIPEYRTRFKAAFGTDTPKSDDVWRAIAAFERTVTQTDTPFDRFLRGDYGALDESQVRGFGLFQGKAGCVQCHHGSLLTDEGYHNIGVPTSGRWETDTLARISFNFMQAELGEVESGFRDDAGLYLYSKRHEDLGKFRTAPLRYTKYTAPYMHNGTLTTLREVVEFYNRGGDVNPFINNKDGKIVKLGLSEDEVTDLVHFLESLSGNEIRIAKPPLPSYPTRSDQ